MSTSSSGYSVFKNGKLIEYGKWKSKNKDWRIRCLETIDQIDALTYGYPPDIIYCEDTNGGYGSNVQTIKMLAVLQGMITYFAYSKNFNIELVLPNVWRSKLGFLDGGKENSKREKLKEKACLYASEKFGLDLLYIKPNSVKNEDDIAEAILIAYAHLK